MKLLDIIITASQNMFRSKVRTLLTIVAIFVGAFTISMTVGISSGISAYIAKQVGNIGAKDALIVQPKIENNFGGDSAPKKYDPSKKADVRATSGISIPLLDQTDLDTIRQQKGILSAQPMLNVSPTYIAAKGSAKYIVTTSSMISGMNFDLVAGENLGEATNQVLIPIKYVSALGFKSNSDALGKVVTFGSSTTLGEQKTVTATIAGVEQESIIGSTAVILNQPLITELYNIQTDGLPLSAKQKYPSIIARVNKNISLTDLENIKHALSSKGYKGSTVDDQIGIIKQVIDAITYVLIFFGAIALLAASFGIINTLYMAVQERTKEIGLMKAMGMRKSRIFMLFSFEAILLGFWGSVIGVLAAMGVGQLINSLASKGFLKDLPGFELTSFPIMPVVLIMLLIMAIAFLAGTLPARRAAKQDPIDALRYE